MRRQSEATAQVKAPAHVVHAAQRLERDDRAHAGHEPHSVQPEELDAGLELRAERGAVSVCVVAIAHDAQPGPEVRRDVAVVRQPGPVDAEEGSALVRALGQYAEAPATGLVAPAQRPSERLEAEADDEEPLAGPWKRGSSRTSMPRARSSVAARDLTVRTAAVGKPPSSATKTMALAPATGAAASDVRASMASMARIDDCVRMPSSPLRPAGLLPQAPPDRRAAFVPASNGTRRPRGAPFVPNWGRNDLGFGNGPPCHELVPMYK